MTERMLHDDVAFAQLTDQLIVDARAMLPERGEAAAQFVTTLSAWLIQLNHRASRQSATTVRAVAKDEAQRALTPILERLSALEAGGQS